MIIMLMKICLFGMVGVMIFSFVVCGNNLLFIGMFVSIIVVCFLMLVMVFLIFVEYEQIKVFKYFSQDDFIKVILSKKINN